MVERGALLDTVRSAARPLGLIGLALEPSHYPPFHMATSSLPLSYAPYPYSSHPSIHPSILHTNLTNQTVHILIPSHSIALCPICSLSPAVHNSGGGGGVTAATLEIPCD